MSRAQTRTNPFYLILVIVGVMFVLTAFAYFTMTLRESNAEQQEPSAFIAMMSEYGLTALVVELAVLAVSTFAAMATDDYWVRRAKAAEEAAALPALDETSTQHACHSESTTT